MSSVDIELTHSVEEEQLRERPELASEPKFLRTPVSPRTFYALLSVAIDRAYKRFLVRFLEMPAGIVLPVLWFAGAALMGSCALALYLAVSALI